MGVPLSLLELALIASAAFLPVVEPLKSLDYAIAACMAIHCLIAYAPICWLP